MDELFVGVDVVIEWVIVEIFCEICGVGGIVMVVYYDL